jgi:hypothetical protein
VGNVHNDELPEDVAERLRELYQSRLDGLQPQPCN